ncbi:copper homeostasis periplasmic binding protein CopC [Pseudomonas sp. GD03842]|uniref:copper homeostasis periplasmic binding protein CopC n=1 Tax=unclassified Pseudomonas TaxID=196821 RepID=UPI000D33F5A7|nr:MULTISPECIES: copper homeostasis periplasmic binding protein CopC [unclassified Pseudomonas]MDH0747751.1 copper homeostasis periplasmic binding protein CopC [Pseudomonas sp. GD03842]RAU39893.1 hypothetical protein DBP26_025265 [Pseudomonas sp. RIT 409]RAU46394.1 hypothetical protein DBY65_025995 [Pseudomonas sp. RIT 412]
MPDHRLKIALTCLPLLASFASSSAFAHAHLESQQPAADSEVTSPKELRLNFSEGVEDTFTKVAISRDRPGDTTEIIQTQSIATDPADKKVLIVVPSVPLAPGKYKVEWHAVSVDTHKSEGLYRFTVTP